MGCGCKHREMLRRTGNAGLEHVTKLATGFSKAISKDIEIYIEGLYNNENLYNFAPIGTGRGEVVKTIYYKNVR